ncbi:hypothetical protein ACFRMQ_14725 [Kitasatospora sp. NPDC056783]|uniref:hypothetical protein n=1 Tax=Kitasatospora sp. NPDC056783 TaxID=3345943 RepID=UPI0036B2ED5A
MDAIARAALRVTDPASGHWYRDASRLSDVRVLRERHAPYCEHPGAVGVGESVPPPPEDPAAGADQADADPPPEPAESDTMRLLRERTRELRHRRAADWR